MEKLITNLQQTYCSRNSYYKSIMKPIFVKRPRISASTIYPGCASARKILEKN